MHASSASKQGLLLAPLLLAAVCPAPSVAEPVPALWGYGVKSCTAFLGVAPGGAAPEALADSEYLLYREWLGGLVTGLNLATGRDVLRGAELGAALVRIRANCEAAPEDNFFTASMRLVKALGEPRAR